jgi:bifunctional NMN adenylyltransferase/nudix hydrolase
MNEEDRRAIEEYRSRHGEGPFLATDAVVSSADGLVLLVRRSKPPQKGRLAFPGGFLKRDETLFDGALRELAEETGLDLRGGPQAKPRGWLLRDAPDRDPRARIVSAAFHFALPKKASAYPVKGADDAAEASWMKLDSSLKPQDFYADHFAILRDFGLLPEADLSHQED